MRISARPLPMAHSFTIPNESFEMSLPLNDSTMVRSLPTLAMGGPGVKDPWPYAHEHRLSMPLLLRMQVCLLSRVRGRHGALPTT